MRDAESGAQPPLVGLACANELPLVWEVVAALPDEERVAALNAGNEALIRSCDSFDELPRTLDDAPEWLPLLQRLDFKLDLLLELLAQRMQLEEALPPKFALRINAQGILWTTPEPPAIGNLLRIICYICPTVPRPLIMHGKVVSLEPVPEIDAMSKAGVTRVTAEFLSVSPGLIDAMERMIFRQHRREIAHLRGLRRSN